MAPSSINFELWRLFEAEQLVVDAVKYRRKVLPAELKRMASEVTLVMEEQSIDKGDPRSSGTEPMLRRLQVSFRALSVRDLYEELRYRSPLFLLGAQRLADQGTCPGPAGPCLVPSGLNGKGRLSGTAEQCTALLFAALMPPRSVTPEVCRAVRAAKVESTKDAADATIGTLFDFLRGNSTDVSADDAGYIRARLLAGAARELPAAAAPAIQPRQPTVASASASSSSAAPAAATPSRRRIRSTPTSEACDEPSSRKRGKGAADKIIAPVVVAESLDRPGFEALLSDLSPAGHCRFWSLLKLRSGVAAATKPLAPCIKPGRALFKGHTLGALSIFIKNATILMDYFGSWDGADLEHPSGVLVDDAVATDGSIVTPLVAALRMDRPGGGSAAAMFLLGPMIMTWELRTEFGSTAPAVVFSRPSQGLKIGELRTALNDKGLSTVGLKSELAARLDAAPVGNEAVPMDVPDGSGGGDGDDGGGSSAFGSPWPCHGQRGFVSALAEAESAAVRLEAMGKLCEVVL